MNRIKENNIKNGRKDHIFWQSFFVYLSLFSIVIIVAIVFWNSLSNLSDYPVADKIEHNNKIDIFPSLQGPKNITFEWEYNGSSYALTETFYKSVYEYYNSKPKVWVSPKDNIPPLATRSKEVRNSIFLFLERTKKDNTISQIASDIKLIGENHGLDEDQIVDLTVSFVQSIPYDNEKAKTNRPLPRYPYEVLYEKKALCSGSSFLTAFLIQELGYGVALFDYSNSLLSTAHMAVGIKCTKKYALYNSDYCYTETTYPGWKVGIIPEDDSYINFETDDGFNFSMPTFMLSSLESDPNIYKIADGKTYEKATENIQLHQKIKFLLEEIQCLKNAIIFHKKFLGITETEDEYNERVEKYNQRIEELKKIKEIY